MVLQAVKQIISFGDNEFSEMIKEAKSYKLSIDDYIRKLVWMAKRIEGKKRNRLEYEADKHQHLWKNIYGSFKYGAGAHLIKMRNMYETNTRVVFDDDEFTEMVKEAKSYKLSVYNYIRKLVWIVRRVEYNERNRLEYEADKHQHLWKF